MGWILKHYLNIERHLINKDVFSVGRDKEADLICRNILVSKHHSEITREDNGQLAVKDLKSSNGTFINEEKITPFEKICLNNGDTLSFGTSKPMDVGVNKGQVNYIFSVVKIPDVIEILTSDEEEEEVVPFKKPKLVKNEINTSCSSEIQENNKLDLNNINIQQTNSIASDEKSAKQTTLTTNIHKKSSLQTNNNIITNAKPQIPPKKTSDEKSKGVLRKESLESVKADIQEGKTKSLKIILPKIRLSDSDERHISKESSRSSSLKEPEKDTLNEQLEKDIKKSRSSRNKTVKNNVNSNTSDFKRSSSLKDPKKDTLNEQSEKDIFQSHSSRNKSVKNNVNSKSSDCKEHEKTNRRSSRLKESKVDEKEEEPILLKKTVSKKQKGEKDGSIDKETESENEKKNARSSRFKETKDVKTTGLKNDEGNVSNDEDYGSINKNVPSKKVEVIENRIIHTEKPTCSKYLDAEELALPKQNLGFNENDLFEEEIHIQSGLSDLEKNEDQIVETNNCLIGKIHIAKNLFSTPKAKTQNIPMLPMGEIKTETPLNYSIGDNVIVLDDDDDEDDNMEFMLSQLYIKPEIKVEEIIESDQTSPRSDYHQNDIITIDDELDELFTSVCSQMYTKEDDGKCEKENKEKERVDDEIYMNIKKEVAALDSYDVPTDLPPIILHDTIDNGDSEDIFDVLNQTNKSPPVVNEAVASSSKENVEASKEYIVPPIIEPHKIVPVKRKWPEPKKYQNKKSKATTRKSPRGKSTVQNSPIRSASTKQNKDIQDARRQKLKEIALKTSKPDTLVSPTNPKITTAKQTKTSSSRGNFLLAPNDHKNNALTALPSTIRADPNTKNSSNSRNKRFVDEYRDVVQSILLWNQKWIFEQKNKHVLPPIAGREVIKMCDSFNSYKDYYNVLQPLIMAELWFNFCKEYESTSMSKQNYSDGNLIAKIKSVKINNYYTEIIFTSYLDKKSSDTGNHIQMKNIALLSAYFGKNTCKTFFGVVVWFQKDQLKKEGKVDERMMKMCKTTPTMKLTFVLAVKKFAEPINTEHPINMRYFTFLPQYLKLIHSVKELATSPLLKHITDPQISLFNIKHQRRKPIVADSLNESQSEALNDILNLFESNKPGMYLLEGPPGTGKSTVIISLIIEWLINLNVRNKCLLLLAPSNAAVDSIISKIVFSVKPMLKEKDRHKIKLLRVGNTSAIDPKVIRYSLDDLAKSAVRTNFLRDHPETQKDQHYLSQQIEELKKKLNVNPMDQDVIRELNWKTSEHANFAQNYLKSKYKSKLEEQKLTLLEHANIICSTLMSSPKIFSKGFTSSSIKMCIIDEASQCSEAETLMPIGLGINKIVLVGDPQQLPAISSSLLVKNYGYCRSLFSRIKLNLSRQAENPIKMLNVQYRMHPEICQFPNNEYYDGKIKTQFNYKKPVEQLKPYLIFSQSTMNTSEYENKKEIEMLLSIIKAISFIIPEEYLSIGIITPYTVQRSSIKTELKKQRLRENINITCNTVDSFQGLEKDIILLSCVRNTPNSFLSDEQRLNVSLTRAKFALYVIASETLLKSCPVLKKINTDARKRGLVHDLRGSSSQSMFIDIIRNKKTM